MDWRGLRSSRAAGSDVMENWLGIEIPEGRRTFVLRKLICYVGATRRYVAAFSDIKKPQPQAPETETKCFHFQNTYVFFGKFWAMAREGG